MLASNPAGGLQHFREARFPGAGIDHRVPDIQVSTRSRMQFGMGLTNGVLYLTG